MTMQAKKRMGQVADRHRKRPGITNADSIPDKGEDDAYGNPFLGLPRLKIKDNAIGPAEADENFLDAKHFIGSGPARLPGGVKIALGTDTDGALDVNSLGGGGAGHTIAPNLMPGLGDITGTLDVANLGGGGAGHKIDKDLIPSLSSLNGDLGPGRVPGLAKLKGKIKAHSQIDWGNKPSVPPNAVGDGYDYRRLDHKPSLKKFLTRADFRADGTLKR